MVRFSVMFPHCSPDRAIQMREQIERVLARESYSLDLTVKITAKVRNAERCDRTSVGGYRCTRDKEHLGACFYG